MEQEPENLYPDFRKNITLKILDILRAGESLKIEGHTGVGKSKYLRYLATSSEIAEKYWAKDKIKLIYIDLNRSYKNTVDQLVETLNASCNIHSSNLEDFEARITEMLKTYSKVYLILDQGELLNDFDKASIRVLRSLRDNFKYKLGYIISVEKGSVFSFEHLKYLLEIIIFKLQIEPLTVDESIENILFFNSKIVEKSKLTDDQVRELAILSEGYPRFIKHITSNLLVGHSFEETREVARTLKAESENNITPEVKTSSQASSLNGHDALLEDSIKFLTKSEFMIFKELYTNQNRITNREKLADLLNPEFSGDGVTDESIDQMISRLRKKLSGNIPQLKLLTKKGFGYYIETSTSPDSEVTYSA